MFPYNFKSNPYIQTEPIYKTICLQSAHLFKTKEQMDAEQWAWIWENLRNYSESSSSGITEGQSGGEDPGNSTNEGSGDSYKPPTGGGGITSTIKANGKTIDFGHGARHLDGTGLDINPVNQRLANEVSKIHPGTGQFYKGQININGITIEYTSYGVSDGVINIGTYYPLS